MDRHISFNHLLIPSAFLLANLLAGCGGGGIIPRTTDFTIAVNGSPQLVALGATATYTITVTGDSSPVAMTAIATPPLTGARVTFTPSSVIPTAAGATSTLTIDTSPETLVGAYTITLTGTQGKAIKQEAVILKIESFSLSVTAVTDTIPTNGTARFTISVRKDIGRSYRSGSEQVALSASGLPIGAKATIDPLTITPTTEGATSVLTIVTRETPIGNYPIAVTGVQGSIAKQATAMVKVTGFAITINPTSLNAGQGVKSARFTVTITPLSGFTGEAWFFPFHSSVVAGKYDRGLFKFTGDDAPQTATLTVTRGVFRVLAASSYHGDCGQ